MEEIARIIAVLESDQALVVSTVRGLHQHRLLSRIIHEVEIDFADRERLKLITGLIRVLAHDPLHWPCCSAERSILYESDLL